MDILRIVSWAVAAICLAGQGADCIITDMSYKLGMLESNKLLAWAVKMRWPSYLIKFGLPIAGMFLCREIGQYAIEKYGDPDIGLFSSYLFFLPGAFIGGYQAAADWKALKAFKAAKK